MTDPGWYKDKTNPELARWHDGTSWTDHTLVIAEQAPDVRPPPPEPAWAPEAAPATAAAPRPSKGDLAAEKARAKAERPWFKKKRYLLSIAFVALMVIAVASSGGDDDKVATGTTDRPASEQPSSAQSRKSELDDVRATSCEVAYGFATIGLQVVNNSSKESNYVITLGLVDATGAKVGDGFGSTNNLKPGQTANIEGSGTVSDAAEGPVSCVVEEVERYAS